MTSTQSQNSEREFRFDDQDFRFLSQLAYEQTGIVLSDHKRDMVYGRLARRLRALDLTDFTDYCIFLKSDEGSVEISHLVNAITTNLTSFFRENHHFQHLRDEVIAPMLQQKNQRLRIWSAACSSGMEPYSIAMSLKHAARDLSGWDARILATDIDSNMLNIAIHGEYSASELKNIPPEYHSYFQHSTRTERLRMKEELQSMIAFRQLNLLAPWPMKGTFDAVFCRNVVIYFDKPTKEKLFARIAETLKPNGWLYIGHSENLHNISDRFQLVGRTIYRKVK
jgi:chemotaxis protein methyltransferase CheR